MRNQTTDEAITPIIGFILLLGILFTLLAILQVVGVPAWNFGVEFDHSQDVRGDIQRLDAGVTEVASTGVQRSVVVELGTRYPRRTVFINPSSPSGRIDSSQGFVNLSGAEAVGGGGVGDYWDGTERGYESRSLVYEPQYNYYDNAPRLVRDTGLLHTDGGDGSVRLSEQSLVNGDTVSLVAVSGDLSVSSVEPLTVSLVPVSVSRTTVPVTNTTGTDFLSLSIDTRLSAEDWDDALADERHVEDVTATGDGVEILLEGGVTYDLRMAEVGIGTNRGVDAEYVVRVGAQDVVTDGSTSLTVEVRDEFNNPVSGATVEADATGGSLDDTTRTTGSDGRATFGYTGTGTVEMEINDGDETYETVVFEVRSSPDAGEAVGDAAYSTFWRTGDTTVTGQTSTDLTVGTSPVADGARVEYSVDDMSVASVTPSGTTDADGEDTVTVTAERDGEVGVYGSSGGSGDVVNVTFEDVPVGPEFVLSEAEIEIQGGQADAVEFDYELSVSEQVDVTFEILDDTGAVVGSTTHTSDGDGTGNPTVEVTDGDTAGGDRQSFPVTVRAEIDGGEVCEVTREQDDAAGFDFCTGDAT